MNVQKITTPTNLCVHYTGSNSTLVNRMGRNYPYPWSFPRRIEDTSEVNQELMVECLLRYCCFVKKMLCSFRHLNLTQ